MACKWKDEVAKIKAASNGIAGPDVRVADGEKVVRTPPAELLFATPEAPSLDVYALGRAVASEWASGPPPALLAIAEIVRNTAKARGLSVFELLTNDKNPDEDGLFGAQGGPTPRYASTARPPTERSLVAAEAALGKNTDIAGGAMRFFHPSGFATFDRAIEVYDAWSKEGWRLVSRAPLYLEWCVDAGVFFILGKQGVSVGTASVEQGRRILENTRKA